MFVVLLEGTSILSIDESTQKSLLSDGAYDQSARCHRALSQSVKKNFGSVNAANLAPAHLKKCKHGNKLIKISLIAIFSLKIPRYLDA